jgi:hypothetical protein
MSILGINGGTRSGIGFQAERKKKEFGDLQKLLHRTRFCLLVDIPRICGKYRSGYRDWRTGEKAWRASSRAQ